MNTFPGTLARAIAHAGGGRMLAATTLAALLVLSAASAVLGHSDLVASDPADTAVLATPPTTVTLTFSEDLDPGKSSFRLVGPAGTVGTGSVSADPVVMTLDGLALAPGDYEIQWTSAALDGDILRGTLTFTVSQPAQASEAPSAEPSATVEPSVAASAEPSSDASSTPTPTSSAAASSEPPPGSGDVVLPIVIALALVAVVGVYLLRRSRRA